MSTQEYVHRRGNVPMSLTFPVSSNERFGLYRFSKWASINMDLFSGVHTSSLGIVEIHVYSEDSVY